MTQRIPRNANPDEKAIGLLEGRNKRLGRVHNLFNTISHSSAVLEFHMSGTAALSNTAVSAALREQLAVSTAGFNGCDYCASAHTKVGAMHKLEADELAANLTGKSADSRTQAALTFNRRVLETRGHVLDGDLQAVRDAGYSDQEIVEVIAITINNVFTNYFNNVAGTEVDFPHVSTSAAKAP